MKFYEYTFADKSAKLIEVPELFDYKTLDIPVFKNSDIITNRENSSEAPPH